MDVDGSGIDTGVKQAVKRLLDRSIGGQHQGGHAQDPVIGRIEAGRFDVDDHEFGVHGCSIAGTTDTLTVVVWQRASLWASPTVAAVAPLWSLLVRPVGGGWRGDPSGRPALLESLDRPVVNPGGLPAPGRRAPAAAQAPANAARSAGCGKECHVCTRQVGRAIPAEKSVYPVRVSPSPVARQVGARRINSRVVATAFARKGDILCVDPRPDSGRTPKPIGVLRQ